MVLEVHETYFEHLKKKKGETEEPEPIQREKFVFRTKFRMIDAIKYAKLSIYMLYLQDEKNRVKAKLYLSNFTIKTHYSFMDLYFRN